MSAFDLYNSFTQSVKMEGDHNILLLCVDTTENQGTEGMGSVDMAYAIHITDGNVENMTPIYPGGLRSPTYTEPSNLGSGMLLLHDSLYGVNNTFGAERAQEIVEYNKGITTDAVVMINPTAVDAILHQIGSINVNGTEMSVDDSIGYIRNMTEQEDSTENRGNATSDLMKPIFKAAESNPLNYVNIAKVALDQYNQGNIRVVPASLVKQFALSMGLSSILGG